MKHRYRILALAVGAAMLSGCVPVQNGRANSNGSAIVGVGTVAGFLHVVREGPNGELTVCTYYSGHNPGDHFQPRGCEQLPTG